MTISETADNDLHNQAGQKDSILEIYEEIKGRIVRREILPDEKINQNNIANELNVSRTPVIKALHMLKSDGLVDNVPNKGFIVHKTSLKDTVELYELRQIVEMIAAANTAEYASMDDIQELDNIFAPFANAEIDTEEYAKADRQFHTRIIALSKNSLLDRINQTVLLLPKAFTSGLLRSPESTLQEHYDIMEAIKCRDARQAQLLAQKHLDITIASLKKAMASLSEIGVDPNKIAMSEIVLKHGD